jgi:hypothetical protein
MSIILWHVRWKPEQSNQKRRPLLSYGTVWFRESREVQVMAESAVSSLETEPSEVAADSRLWWRCGRRRGFHCCKPLRSNAEIVLRRQPARMRARELRNVHCSKMLPSSAVKIVAGNSICVWEWVITRISFGAAVREQWGREEQPVLED